MTSRVMHKADVAALPDTPEGTGTLKVLVSATLMAQLMDRPFRFEDSPDRSIAIRAIYMDPVTLEVELVATESRTG